MNHRKLIFILCVSGCLWQWFSVLAQETPEPAPTVVGEPESRQKTAQELRDDELAISGRFERFERMLTQMADILGRQDPERADLLRRAIGKGREDQVREEMEKIVDLLSKGELGTASEKQTAVVASLDKLLKLLQSEDRRSSVERERERLNGLLNNVRNVIAEQKSARSTTRNSEAPSNAAPGQQRALSETDKLLDSIKEHDEQQAKEDQGDSENATTDNGSEGKDAKGSKEKGPGGKDAKGKDAKEGGKGNKAESEPKDGKAGDDKSTGKQSGRGKTDPQEGKQGKSSSGQKQSGKESKQTPGRNQLEKAREQMEEALKDLKEQQRENALKNEDQAIEELLNAAAELEDMLKQLREEEKEMLLASLEARFQRMLIAETQIHESTLSLAATPQKDWLDQYYGLCRELAQQQSELASECDQTVNLLREDGTSVSILLAVEDIDADMGSVSGWLQESKVGELTQSVQNDIIESLKQLIEVTQKEMQEMKEQQQQQKQGQQQNNDQNQGLVELMAEVRMLRNLQLQVNRRTKQVDRLLQSASTDDLPSLSKQVHDLAVRQRRLIESAKELAKQTR